MPNEAAKHPIVEFKEFLAPRTSELAGMLPSAIAVEKFKQVCVTAAIQNPKLAFADRASLWGALRRCAADGLLPDGKEAVLQVYETKQKDGTYKQTASYQPMVAGIYKRTRNSGEISALYGHEVYKNDKFRIRLGFNRDVEHEPALGERGPIIGAYACVEFKDGGRDIEWMPREDIEKARAKSKAPDSLMWREFYGEGCIKTVIKRFGKRLPVSSDIVALLNRDDDASDEALPALAEPPKSIAFTDEPAFEIEMPLIKEQASAPATPAADAPDAGANSEAATSARPPEPKPAPAKAPAAELQGDRSLDFEVQIGDAKDATEVKGIVAQIEADKFMFPLDKEVLLTKARDKLAAMGIARAGR